MRKKPDIPSEGKLDRGLRRKAYIAISITCKAGLLLVELGVSENAVC